MLNVPQFRSEKNRVGPSALKAFVMLFELAYDLTDPNNPAYVRFAEYNVPVQFEGNVWSPFPLGGVEISVATTGEVPAFDIAVSNAGRYMIGLLEIYELENKPGRLVWVHPDASGGSIVGNVLVLTDPTAKIEEHFTVLNARATEATAILTCASITFDPLTVMLPTKTVESNDFPGVLGNASRYIL